MKIKICAFALFFAFLTAASASQGLQRNTENHRFLYPLKEAQIELSGARPALKLRELPPSLNGATAYIVATGADWCGPCQIMKNSRFLEGVQSEFERTHPGQKIGIFEINASPEGENTQTASLYPFALHFTNTLPTLHFFNRDGKHVVGPTRYSLVLNGFLANRAEERKAEILSFLDKIQRRTLNAPVAGNDPVQVQANLLSKDVRFADFSKDKQSGLIWTDSPADVTLLFLAVEGSVFRSDFYNTGLLQTLQNQFQGNKKFAMKELRVNSQTQLGQRQIGFFEMGLAPTQLIMFIKGKQGNIRVSRKTLNQNGQIITQDQLVNIYRLGPYLSVDFNRVNVGYEALLQSISAALGR